MTPAWFPSTHGKEIEATDEWTLLGENDTVAAGMHIRIDMTTGERMVKLPEHDTPHDTSLVIAADGSMGENNGGDTTSSYDYEMMFRALSRLPEEERIRIGLDASVADDHEKLREIWEQRQEALRELEVMDLPQVLKDTIRSIQDFLEHPVAALVDLVTEDGGLDEGRGILQTLVDLEFQLQDIDMTRDFHTLGGWPVLGSLLSDKMLQEAVAADATNATLDLNVAVDAFHVLQSKAAWALGTAVKNTEEFHPYVLERSIGAEGFEASALDLVVSQLADSSSAPIEKQIKLVYCLGSFLRGNQGAQEYFAKHTSTKFLPRLLTDSLTAPKLHNKLLRLITDLRRESPNGSVMDELCDIIGGSQTFTVATTDTYLETVATFVESCASMWEYPVMRDRLSSILEHAEEQSDLEPGDDRREAIQSTLSRLKSSTSRIA